MIDPTTPTKGRFTVSDWTSYASREISKRPATALVTQGAGFAPRPCG